jgi:hypothetical protein
MGEGASTSSPGLLGRLGSIALIFYLLLFWGGVKYLSLSLCVCMCVRGL